MAEDPDDASVAVLLDDHLVGIIVMAVLALGAAGTTWGLGHWWNRTDVVQKYPALR